MAEHGLLLGGRSLGRASKLCAPSLVPHHLHLFICVLCNQPLQVSVSQSYESDSSKFIKPKEEPWGPQLETSQSGVLEAPHLFLVSSRAGEGGSLGHGALTLGSDAASRWTVSELKSGTPSWCPLQNRLLVYCWGEIPTHLAIEVFCVDCCGVRE